MENNLNQPKEQELALLSDDELVVLAKKGVEDAVTTLIIRYKPIIKQITRKFFIYRGLDSEDLVQEATLAFIKAIHHHDTQKNVLFKTFSIQCIENKLRDVIRRNTTVKNEWFTTALSITELDENETKIFDANEADPLTKAIQKELVEKIHLVAKEGLTEEQYEVLVLFLEGYSYSEIAEKLSLKSTKQVDNSLTAAKRVLRKRLSIKNL